MDSAKKSEIVEAPSVSSGFFKKLLSGSTFLTLEHVAHMTLVVIIPALILISFWIAISIWTGTSSFSGMLTSIIDSSYSSTLKYLEVMASLGFVAAQIVLVPILVILDRRTRAEWQKRKGYAETQKFKVPIYIAMAVSGITVICSMVQMVYVILASFALIGVTSAEIGNMYLTSFLPAALTLITFAAIIGYLFKLIKGYDKGRMFCMVTSVISAAIVLALFITAIVVMHDGSVDLESTDSTNTTDDSNYYDSDYYNYDDQYYQDYYQDLYDSYY